MQYAISLNTVLPVRAQAAESSEMVTQLLFGDICTVCDQSSSFVRIKNYHDDYEGWVDKKMLSEISPETYNQLTEQPVFRTNTPIADVFCLTDKSMYRLSLGSLLPFYNHETSKFEIVGKTFQIHPSFVTYLPGSTKENIIPAATLFLNAPYLWGGKNIMGIDCSGLVQVVYSLNGFTLPRDAGVQEKEGTKIESLADAEATDLLFFEKENKITHVGIYMGEGKIIHASGKVRIDNVNEQGIYNTELSEYTHSLSSIKRI